MPPRAHELDALLTESGGDADLDYEHRTTEDLVVLMSRADREVPEAVLASSTEIASAIDAIVERLERGGRLVYVGAGSSGRIAALDAAECESTFSTRAGQVVAIQAGGHDANPLDQEAAEDDHEAGGAAILELGIGPLDAVVGVSASGRTPFVLGAVAEARRLDALTVGIVAVGGSALEDLVERQIVVAVGPEFLAGSTRLKAGTAQKLVLNAISTISMIRLGKTFGNLMVDVNATNEKLRARVLRIVETATGVPSERAEEALFAADGNTKVAILTLLAEIAPDEARTLLAESSGNVRLALERRERS
jgi:N-acetylmuramic acid 6-phosphate etherase